MTGPVNEGTGGRNLHPDQLPGLGLNPAVTITSSSYVPRDTHQPRGKRPWCPTCDTDLHLEVESPTVPGRQAGTLAVAVLCSNCRRSRVLDTTAEHLAALSAQRTRGCPLPHLTAP